MQNYGHYDTAGQKNQRLLRFNQNHLITALLTYYGGVLIFSSKVVSIGQATSVQ